MHGTKVYNTWKRIRQRCNNKNVERYENYGGRGIKICSRWDEFINFYLDMGDPPTSKHSIERIDVDGDYEPGNCVWATLNQQAVNTTKRKDNTSGYTGVFKNGNNWGAKLNWHNKVIAIGTFKTPELAAIARDKYIEENNLPHRKSHLHQ